MPGARSSRRATEVERRTHRLPGWIILVSLGIVALYAGFAVALWRFGLFKVPKGGPDARIVVAAVGLLGGLFATLMTFVGVLLKHAIDTRTLELERETQGRLKLETSIRAVELLATEAGKSAPPTQQAGALFALANLNQLELGVALLSEVWPRGDISAAAAVWLIDQALLSDDDDLRYQAANILRLNAARLPETGGCLNYPNSILERWRGELPLSVRDALVDALVDGLGARPCAEWSADCLNGLIVQFDGIRKSDPSDQVKANATLALDGLHPAELACTPFGLRPPNVEQFDGPLREFLRNKVRLRKNRAKAVDRRTSRAT